MAVQHNRRCSPSRSAAGILGRVQARQSGMGASPGSSSGQRTIRGHDAASVPAPLAGVRLARPVRVPVTEPHAAWPLWPRGTRVGVIRPSLRRRGRPATRRGRRSHGPRGAGGSRWTSRRCRPDRSSGRRRPGRRFRRADRWRTWRVPGPDLVAVVDLRRPGDRFDSGADSAASQLQ